MLLEFFKHQDVTSVNTRSRYLMFLTILSLQSYSNADFRSPDNADFRLRCNVAQWASSTHFPEVVTLSEVGPQVPTGPNYLQGE